MFGQNPIRKIDVHRDGSLMVHSVFLTIQGEGPHAGRPAVFLRLAGCSLACSFCDTEFEEGAKRMQAKEAVASILNKARPSTSLVVITGGEPLRQDIGPASAALARMGWHVQVETAGIHPIGAELEILVRKGQASIVCSPKTGKLHPDMDEFAACFKYLVSADDEINGFDGLPVLGAPMGRHGTRGALARPNLGNKAPIFLQPIDANGSPEANRRNMQAAAELAIQYNYRLSIQIHKIVGLD